MKPVWKIQSNFFAGTASRSVLIQTQRSARLTLDVEVSPHLGEGLGIDPTGVDTGVVRLGVLDAQWELQPVGLLAHGDTGIILDQLLLNRQDGLGIQLNPHQLQSKNDALCRISWLYGYDLEGICRKSQWRLRGLECQRCNTETSNRKKVFVP